MPHQMSTHVLVLAATYPELKAVLERVMRQPLTSESFAAYQQSMVHAAIIFNFVMIVQSHASNYNSINTTLKKIDDIIERIGKIDYGQLTDAERKSLPELAKDVDAAGDSIRKEVAPKLMEEKQHLLDLLNKQLLKSGEYLSNVGNKLDEALVKINKKFSLDLSWTKGKSITNWFELEKWLAEKPEVAKWKINVLGAQEEKTTLLLKGILMTEYLMSEERHKNPETVDEVLEFIANMPLVGVEFEIMKPKKGVFVDHMDKTSGEVQNLYDQLFSFPIEGKVLSDDLATNLEKLSKQDQLFTQVDKPVEN